MQFPVFPILLAFIAQAGTGEDLAARTGVTNSVSAVTTPSSTDRTGIGTPSPRGLSNLTTDSTAAKSYPFDLPWPRSETPQDVEIHGFLSQGAIYSTKNNYLARSSEGSFEFGEAGINFNKELTQRLRFGLQLFAQTLGSSQEAFQVRADWFHLDYRYDDWLGFRAGRVKLPFGLFNDVNDIDAARVPILLPQSIYPVQNRNFLLAQSGGEIYGYVNLSELGSGEYRVYGGTIVLDIEDSVSAPFRIQDVRTPYVAGSRLLWETPFPGFRVAGSLQALELDADLFFPAITQTVSVRLPAVLWVASIEYTLDRFQAVVEYGRWHVTTKSSLPSAFPPSKAVSERMYAMATYRLTDWLHLGSYASRLLPEQGKVAGRENRQDDYAATLRFDLNNYWLVKLESHFMSGTAVLEPDLNDGTPLSALPDKWGFFLMKTTVTF